MEHQTKPLFASLGQGPAPTWQKDPDTGQDVVSIPDVCGGFWWAQLHSWAENIRDAGCPSCGEFAVKVAEGVHDVVNNQLGRRLEHPESVLALARAVADTLENNPTFGNNAAPELVKATAAKVIDGVSGFMNREPVPDTRPTPTPAPEPEGVLVPERPRLFQFDWADWVAQIAALQRCATADEDAIDRLQAGDQIDEQEAGVLQEWLTCIEDQAFIIDVAEAMEQAKQQLVGLAVPDETLATYETLLREHRGDPCVTFIWLAKRTSRFRSTPSVTIRQFQRILGKAKIPDSVNLLPGRLVPWEIAVDEPADELDMTSDEFERCILRAFDRQFELFDLLEELERKTQNVPTSRNRKAHSFSGLRSISPNGTQEWQTQGRHTIRPRGMYLRSLTLRTTYPTLPYAPGSQVQRALQGQVAEQRLLQEIINGVAFTVGAGIAGFALKRIESTTGVDVSQEGHLSPKAMALDVSGQGGFISERVADIDDFHEDSIRTVVSKAHRVRIGCPVEKFDGGECKSTTRAISILHPRSEKTQLVDEAKERGVPVIETPSGVEAEIEEMENTEIQKLLDEMMEQGILAVVLEP